MSTGRFISTCFTRYKKIICIIDYNLAISLEVKYIIKTIYHKLVRIKLAYKPSNSSWILYRSKNESSIRLLSQGIRRSLGVWPS